MRSTVSRCFACEPTAPADARHLVADALTRWHRDDVIDTATLVVSELATNAVVHANTPFVLTVTAQPTAIRLAISDASAVVPKPRHPSAHTPSGRGLLLVAAMSDAWGTELGDTGKTVWAELASVPT